MFNSFRGQGRANYLNPGAGIRAARLRRDLSALFVIPNVPPSTPMAPQPDGFRGRLFDYQRRSLHRMLEIEREGVEVEVTTGVVTHKFKPRGGVIAVEEDEGIFAPGTSQV